MPDRPVTHEPHSFILVFRHDCGVKHVLSAMCDEGRCNREITDAKVGRNAAAGIEMINVPGLPLGVDFNWTHEEEVLFNMAHLKLASHEGRQKTVDHCRARLVELSQRRRFK